MKKMLVFTLALSDKNGNAIREDDYSYYSGTCIV